MTCMCGDYCCSSCGPAQGNWRCPICNVWASEVCEHISDDGNGIKEEFVPEAERIAAAQAEADNRFATDMIEEERLIEEWMFTQGMRIASTGHVGIGTNAPTSKPAPPMPLLFLYFLIGFCTGLTCGMVLVSIILRGGL